MTIAILVESKQGEVSQQTLLFPHKGEVHIYHRDSTGMAGRGQTWNRVQDVATLPTTYVPQEPVAVLLTERDTQLVDSGLVTNIGAKALYALESAEPITAPMPHREAVENLRDSLIKGDQSLTAYITDKRRLHGVTLTPLTGAPVQVQFVPQVQSQPIVESVPPTVDKVSQLAYENMISIPDPKWSRDYINRYFEDGKSDYEIYDYALENDVNVLIEGGAGSGKTMSVIAYASTRQKRYFNVSSNAGIDPSQLFGRWIPRDDGHGYRWQDGAVTLLVRHGGVLLLNEINFMPERIMTVLYSLLDDRREIQLLDNGGEVIKAHPDLLIVADMNAGYRGTHELSQANNDRWKIKLEFPYDKNIESKLIKSKSLLELLNKLRDQYEREEITTPISTRGAVAFIKNAKGVGFNFALTSYINGFDKDERSAVRMSFEAYKTALQQELGLAVEIPPTVESDLNIVESLTDTNNAFTQYINQLSGGTN